MCYCRYNFSALSGYELQGFSNPGTLYTFKMCGTITQNTYCTTGNAANSMICQQYSYPGTPSNAISVASWNPTALAFGFTNGVDASKGIAFIAEDGSGAYCSSYHFQPRTAYVNFVCGRNVVPANFTVQDSAYPCVYSLTIVTSIVCSPAQLAAFAVGNPVTAANSAFAGMGYSFAALTTQDISVQLADAMYVLHLGGVVSDPFCSQDTVNGGAGSMICQNWQMTPANPAPQGSYGVSTWNASQARWSFTNNKDWTGGVTLALWDGSTGSCNNGFDPRYAIINFVCDPSVTGLPPASKVNVTELATSCSYAFTVATSIVCTAPTTTVATPGCSWAGIDFSQLTGNTLYGYDGNTYTMNLCSAVTTPGCPANSMICQQYNPGDPTVSISVSSYNPANMPWGYINGYDISGGLQVLIESGNSTYCNNNANRTAYIQFRCGPTVIPAELSGASGYPFTPYHGNSMGASDGSSCQYTFQIFTSLVCTPSQLAGWTQTLAGVSTTAPNTGFVGMGYDFSSLTTQDVSVYSYTGYWYTVHLGGVVQDSLCQTAYVPGTQNSMICQKVGFQPNNYYSTWGVGVASWNPALTSWSYINGANYTSGVQLALLDGSVSYCTADGLGRLSYIQFLCSPTQAAGSYALNVTFDGSCTYTFTVMTAIVCTPSGLVQPQCQGLGYDFSAFYNSPTDLLGYNGDGDLYTLHLCGLTRNGYCNNGTNSVGAMLCQQDALPLNPAETYSVSVYTPSAMVWGFVNNRDYTNGVYLATQTGASIYCNGVPREMIIIFLCGGVTSQIPSSMAVADNLVTGCFYQFTIYTSIVCQAPTGQTNIGPGGVPPPQLSSSAVAAISSAAAAVSSSAAAASSSAAVPSSSAAANVYVTSPTSAVAPSSAVVQLPNMGVSSSSAAAGGGGGGSSGLSNGAIAGIGQQQRRSSSAALCVRYSPAYSHSAVSLCLCCAAQ